MTTRNVSNLNRLDKKRLTDAWSTSKTNEL